MTYTLVTNTMRYGFSGFSFRKEALLEDNKPLSTKNFTTFNGFTITGKEPVGTARKVLFKVDEKYWKLTVDSNGTATPVEVVLGSTSDNSLSVDTVMDKGNTVSELESVKKLDSWLEKDIYPIIALTAPPEITDANNLPTISLALRLTSSTELYTFDEESSEFSLIEEGGTDGEVIQIDAAPITTGKGTAVIKGAICNAAGEYSAWMTLDEMKNKSGTKVKFKISYSVANVLGTDSAKVDSLTMQYSTNVSTVTGSQAELIMNTVEYINDLKYAQLVLKHKPLKDATMKAYVAFRPRPLKRTQINLGIGAGTGKQQSFKLNDNNINHNTLKVFSSGSEVLDFDFNTTDGEIVGHFEEGAPITASYEYNYQPEVWQEMELVLSEEEDALHCTTKYQFTNALVDQTISCVKVVMDRPTGTNEHKILGKGTGFKQIFMLDHQADPASVKVTRDGNTTPNWTYNQDNRLLTVVAPEGSTLGVWYDWVAETEEINDVFVGWSI